MDRKSDFILAAIHDAQATIRSVDLKVAALLAGLIVPLASLGNIWNHFVNISSLKSIFIASSIGIIFLIFWLASIFSLVRTISAIDNPADHIVNSSEYKGIFYGNGLFKFGWLDVLFNRSVIKADKDVSTFSLAYPSDEKEIISELSFEHMKLIYIREVKLHRFKYSLRFAFIWLILGMGIYLFSKTG
jgi:hypothetical protein